MKNPMRSLAGRITLLVFAATLTSSAAVSWIAVQSLEGFLHSKVEQRLPLAAERIAREIDEWYSLRSRDLAVFADSTILRESSPSLEAKGRQGDQARADAEQYLQYILASFPQFERLIITRTDGTPLLEIGSDTPLPDGFLKAIAPADTVAISDAQRLGDQLFQVASVPLHDNRNLTVARLFALIELDRLAPILASEELGENANTFLVDRDGFYLNASDARERDARFSGPDGANDALHGGVAHYDDALGLSVIGTRFALPRFGWSVVLEQSFDEAFAPVVASISRVIGLNFAIIVCFGLAALRIARSIVQPLRALSDGAIRLSTGERQVEIDETHSSDEVDVLTRAFNDMSRALGRNAQELEENHRVIEAANNELTQKNAELSSFNLVLEQLSITDGLTKLHNHRYFQDYLAQECKRSARTEEPLCLVLIDIDYFKRWNDRLGHAGGDEILRRMAEVLNESVRETDLLARYGGEEFALLAINTDLAGATALGEKVREAVFECDFVTDVPSEEEPLTVSVGVAIFSGDRKQLFVDADEALYKAKDDGRNRVVVAKPRKRAKKKEKSG